MNVKILKLKVKEIDFNPYEPLTEILTDSDGQKYVYSFISKSLSESSHNIDMFLKKSYAESVRELILYYDPEENPQLKKSEKRIMKNIQKRINEKYMVISSGIEKEDKPHYMRFLISMQDFNAINTFGDEDYAQILDWVNDALTQSNISPLSEIELECKEF